MTTVIAAGQVRLRSTALLSPRHPLMCHRTCWSNWRRAGRLIMPVGEQSTAQTLLRITATESGFVEEKLGKVAFVPMIED